jgi:UTP--glucose-1-phosphate uridylyltransferase
MLEKLLSKGKRWAFISNIDNLGATIDPAILKHLDENQIPFLMEVSSRSEADKKGGHLALSKEGQFVLRERAQCPQNELDSFEDISKYKFFNTNNIWVDLLYLKKVFLEKKDIIPLPVIVNAKTVDPKDSNSTQVLQLETAMGAAIGSIPGSSALCIPKKRFAPVKTTNDLLVVRSDAYVLNKDFSLTPATKLKGKLPLVKLDPKHFKMMRQFDERFPQGAPSLINCSQLLVEGDYVFGKGIIFEGKVSIRNPEKKQLHWT